MKNEQEKIEFVIGACRAISFLVVSFYILKIVDRLMTKKIKITAEQYQKLIQKEKKKQTIITPDKYKNRNSVPINKDYRTCSNKGWRKIDNKSYYFRSSWEMNYACFLNFLKKKNQILDWQYEPKTFWFEKIKRGVRSYLPDFIVKLNDGTEEIHEVKGYMDQRSKTKIKRMEKYYPDIKIIIIDKDWFDKNKHLNKIIEGWE